MIFLAMSFRQIEKQKDPFFKSYTAIENISNVSHWYCCCHIYFGCQTIQNLLRNQKRYCCYCQFKDRYSLLMLDEVKRDFKRMKVFYHGLLEDFEVFRFTKNISYFACNFDTFDPFCYVKNMTEQQRSDLKDFLFYSRRIKNRWFFFNYY